MRAAQVQVDLCDTEEEVLAVTCQGSAFEEWLQADPKITVKEAEALNG